MRNKKWIIFVAIALIAVSVFVFLNSKKKKGTVEIKEVSPEYGDIRTVISVSGNVQPQNRLEVKPSINGRVDRILVNEGDKVKKGDVLALMSSTERAALLDSAKSESEQTYKYWEDVYKPSPLIAPINGEVIVKAVEPGQSVNTGSAVIVLSDRLIVQAQIDETDIGKIKVGQNAIVSLDAYPEQKVRARVDHIAYESTVVSNVTIYQVEILPLRVPDVFRSGMSANVDIITQEKKDILLLPVEAVKQNREGSFVFVKDPQTNQETRRMVKTGITDEKNIEIVSGMQESDKVIIKNKAYSLPSKNTQQGTNPFMPGGRRH